MNIFRLSLPLYQKFIKKYSKGKGYGQKKSIRKILSFFDSIYRSNEVKVHGHKMFLPKKGFAAYSTWGIYGEFDTKTVESIVKPGEIVIDVGAAIGYYTLILAKAVGKDGKVFAFEPKDDRFEYLIKNIEINNYDNVKLEKEAILPKDISSNFFERSDGRAGLRFITNDEKQQKHTSSVKVSAVDLDEYLKNLGISQKISFIKIDVDGPELLVLKSSKSLLKNDNLKIFIEWDQDSAEWSKCDPEEMINLLLENDFKIYFPDYKNNKFFKITKTELLAKKSKEQINLLCVKDPSILENNNLL